MQPYIPRLRLKIHPKIAARGFLPVSYRKAHADVFNILFFKEFPEKFLIFGQCSIFFEFFLSTALPLPLGGGGCDCFPFVGNIAESGR